METNLKFDIYKKDKSLYIEMSSQMALINSIDFETRKFLINNNLKKQIFSVCLILREGLTNAVKHGNNFNCEKIVKYSIKLEKDKLVVVIEDEGKGFNWKEQKTDGSCLIKKHNEDEVKDSGRGRIIMARYFNDHSYNSKGNILTLKKKI